MQKERKHELSFNDLDTGGCGGGGGRLYDLKRKGAPGGGGRLYDLRKEDFYVIKVLLISILFLIFLSFVSFTCAFQGSS